MMISHNFAHKIQSNASKMSSAQITQCPPLNASTRVEAWTYGTIPGIPGAFGATTRGIQKPTDGKNIGIFGDVFCKAKKCRS